MTDGRDNRVDPSWAGPMPEYEAMATISLSVTREELIVYFSHVMAQVIDIACGMSQESGEEMICFPEGSPWDRDWHLISSMGMTEAEVSLLLSDIDGTAFRNMANLALGLAIDKVLSEHGPSFVVSATSALLGIVSRCGEEYAVSPEGVTD